MRSDRSGVATVPVALVLAAAPACSDEPVLPPILWEGEHVRFGTDADDDVICAGTLPYLDGAVGHLGAVFGRPDARVDYYWLPEGTGEHCDEDVEGCADEHRVFSRYTIHQHELVHAVRFPSQLYLPFEEGLAEAYGDDWERFPVQGDIRELLEDPMRNDYIPGPGYGLAAHFVSYLDAKHGLGALVMLDDATSYRDSFADAEAAFRRVYDQSLDEAIDEYRSDYPRCDTPAFRHKTFDCSRNVVEAPIETDERLDLTVSLACEDPAVLGPRLGQRWTTVTLDVRVAGQYHIFFAPVEGNALELVRITRCDISCFEYPDDLPSRTTGHQFGSYLCLEQGRYLFRFAIDEDQEGDYQLAVTRTDRPCG